MGAKILIVDDSQTIRSSLRECILNINSDYQVIEGADGEDGFRVLEANPDTRLIFCDINMPWKSGLELLEDIKGNTNLKDIPFLLLTTESDVQMINRGKELGARGWILKPFDREKIEAIINRFIKV